MTPEESALQIPRERIYSIRPGRVEEVLAECGARRESKESSEVPDEDAVVLPGQPVFASIQQVCAGVRRGRDDCEDCRELDQDGASTEMPSDVFVCLRVRDFDDSTILAAPGAPPAPASEALEPLRDPRGASPGARGREAPVPRSTRKRFGPLEIQSPDPRNSYRCSCGIRPDKGAFEVENSA